MKKVILKLIPVLMLAVIFISVTTTSFASGLFKPEDVPVRDESNTVSSVDNSLLRVWSSVVLVLQMASVGAFIFAGVRYMFASAETKANIKQQVVYLIVGAIIVFCSTTVINFIIKAAGEIMPY